MAGYPDQWHSQWHSQQCQQRPDLARRGRASRRRIRPVDLLLVRPLRLLLVAYVHALVRAIFPWLVPLGILAVVVRLTLYLGSR